MTAAQKIKAIIDRWFVTEPLLFSTCCTHSLVENEELKMPFRSGCRRIEYSPKLIDELKSCDVEEWLKVEIFRILLGHPYHRIPKGAEKRRKVLLMTSDVTINQFYKAKVETCGVNYLKTMAVWLDRNPILMKNGMSYPVDYFGPRHRSYYDPKTVRWENGKWVGEIVDSSLEVTFLKRNIITEQDKTSPHYGELQTVDDLSFEQWYKWMNFLASHSARGYGEDDGSEKEEVDDVGNKGENQIAFDFSEAGDLWKEDQEMKFQIEEVISNAVAKEHLENYTPELKAEITAQSCVPLDYRKILGRFKSSIFSSSRYFTRMRPSRRFGYEQMGYRYKRDSKILIAVDVSGSISDEVLRKFFSIIKEFFHYGIHKLDVIQFDSKASKPVQLKKGFEKMKVVGRGGTDFNPPVNFYLAHKEYDGMIILTDGFGCEPKCQTNRRMNVVWLLTNKKDHESASLWISKFKGHMATFIPSEVQ